MAKPSHFTTKIDLSLAKKLEEDLKAQGFELSKPPYTVFAAKKKGVSCTLYESGSLMVQGKEMAPFLEFYLEPEILKSFAFSHQEALLDLTPRIGLDEAGKGDFFGPLCVAALYGDGETIPKLHQMGVKDSKTIGDPNILKLAKKIRLECPYTVIRLFPQKYNELYGKFKNLNRLLGWAHVAALGDLSQKTGCRKAILDQFADESVVKNAMRQKKLELDLEQKVRGEADIVVAGASILARAAFVEGIEMLSSEYGIILPKGASRQVITVGEKMVAKFGKEVLGKIAKTHFKTMSEIDVDLP